MATWQESMTATASSPSKIASEIARASSIISSGKGTVETTRYLNQMNALKDGASLTKVVSGQYDNYSYDKSGTYVPSSKVGSGLSNAGIVNSVGTAVGAPTNWNLIKAAENIGSAGEMVYPRDYGGGVVGVSGMGESVGQAGGVTQYDDPADNRTVTQALSQGMAQVMPDMSGMVNTGIMVIAGAAVLMAVSKIFGK